MIRLQPSVLSIRQRDLLIRMHKHGGMLSMNYLDAELSRVATGLAGLGLIMQAPVPRKARRPMGVIRYGLTPGGWDMAAKVIDRKQNV